MQDQPKKTNRWFKATVNPIPRSAEWYDIPPCSGDRRTYVRKIDDENVFIFAGSHHQFGKRYTREQAAKLLTLIGPVTDEKEAKEIDDQLRWSLES